MNYPIIGTSDPVMFDCDTGIDDSFALLYLLAKAQLIGIISTAGNVTGNQVHLNNKAWLALTNREDIPVYPGASVPLVAPLKTTEETHGPHGVGNARLPYDRITAPDPSLDGAAAWIEASYKYPGNLVGLITGPCTSYAQALQQDPTVPSRIKRLVIMGGVFYQQGNTTPRTEWNVDVDPEALQVVLQAHSNQPQAPSPILCPLDVTETIIFTPQQLADLSAQALHNEGELMSSDQPPDLLSSADNPIIRCLSDALRFYFHFHYQEGIGFLAHMHDPFAAIIALNPHLATITPAFVDVELVGTITRGETVADLRHQCGRTANAGIIFRTNPDVILSHYVDSLRDFLTQPTEPQVN